MSVYLAAAVLLFVLPFTDGILTWLEARRLRGQLQEDRARESARLLAVCTSCRGSGFVPLAPGQKGTPGFQMNVWNAQGVQTRLDLCPECRGTGERA